MQFNRQHEDGGSVHANCGVKRKEEGEHNECYGIII